MKRLKTSKANVATQTKRLINEALGRTLGFEVALKKYHPDAIMRKVRASGLLETLDRNQLFVLQYGIFDSAASEFYLLHDTGLFSCLNVTLWSICDLIGAGFIPKKINFSRTLTAYRDSADTDLHPQLFRAPLTDELASRLSGFERERYRHFDHHGPYGKLDFELLSILIQTYLCANQQIDARIDSFRAQYLSPDAQYVGVCIRGTDKGSEVPPTDSSFYVEETDRLLRAGNVQRVLLQTDQAQICDVFKHRFDGRCDVIEAVPRTSGKVVLHRTAEIESQRVEFARNIVAAISVISTTRCVVTHTGNIGAWIAMLRGSSNDLWQQRPEGLVLQ